MFFSKFPSSEGKYWSHHPSTIFPARRRRNKKEAYSRMYCVNQVGHITVLIVCNFHNHYIDEIEGVYQPSEMKQYLPYKPCSLHALIYCDMYTHTERMLLNKSCTVHTLIYCDIYIHNQRMLLYKSCTLHTLIHTMKGRLYTISSKLRYYSPVRYLHFFKRRINWKSYLNSS